MAGFGRAGLDFPPPIPEDVSYLDSVLLSHRPGRPRGDGAPEYRRGEGAVLLREDGVPALRGQLQPPRPLQLAPRQRGAHAGVGQGRGDLRALFHSGKRQHNTRSLLYI